VFLYTYLGEQISFMSMPEFPMFMIFFEQGSDPQQDLSSET
jgi:hypothetical protein